MRAKKIVLSALITGLLVWGLTEMFNWILADLIGAGEISRISPALAGAVLGICLSMLTQAIRKKRKEMSGEVS